MRFFDIFLTPRKPDLRLVDGAMPLFQAVSHPRVVQKILYLNMKLPSPLLLLLLLSARGAVTALAPLWLGVRAWTATGLTERNNHDTTLLDRRNLIQGAILAASGILLPALAEVKGIGMDPAHPIVVIGAGGKVRFEFTLWVGC